MEDLARNEARRRSAHAERLLDGRDRQILSKWHELKWRRRAIASSQLCGRISYSAPSALAALAALGSNRHGAKSGKQAGSQRG